MKMIHSCKRLHIKAQTTPLSIKRNDSTVLASIQKTKDRLGHFLLIFFLNPT